MVAARRDKEMIDILVADEDCDWVGGLARLLAGSRVRVWVADSRHRSLEILRREQVDLVLIAVDVPRLGGLDFVRRAHELVRDLPMVLLGPRLDRRWLEQALTLRPQGVLPRPVDPRRVLEMIWRYGATSEPHTYPTGLASAN